MYPYYNYGYTNSYMMRPQTLNGTATWTNGGNVTKCGIPWSYNQYMTVAVSSNSSFQCGQTLKVTNPQNGREAIVTVVDTVPNVPANQLNLHQRAFQILANPSVGVLPVQFQASPEVEQEKWGKYLLEVTQTAYPNYNVTDYGFVERTPVTNDQVKEVYDFYLTNGQEQLTVRGTVVYNPMTNRVVSFGITEL
ncbi:DUF3889 domain-containing protein [Gracilibacillus salinarum]|uniref:DUF3889 domain-containing protein n=1 Tax=Gracilibacillus salinarum TaxID=2932255 RepID=A0ABY4GSN5_9BACI|nr:DUF3889 domain-containing protein [Gracilibacillus salinarum]UOQ87153.1 DUF3889 domain-containing protein [Gracilibacillus salinarum]